MKVRYVVRFANCRNQSNHVCMPMPVRALIGRIADPGGVGTVCNELAQACGLAVLLEEDRLPVQPMVAGACELLGIDPLYVANEGRFVAVVESDEAAAALAALRAHPLGAGAARIGEIVAESSETVMVRTGFGGSRIVDMLVGDPLP